MIDFDNVLVEIGERGRYQSFIFFLLCIPATIPAAFIAFNQVFVTAVPDHWCWVPELSNLTVSERRTLAIPVNIAGQFEKCRMYSVNYTWLWRQRGSSRWSSLVNASWPRHECTHGWEYDANYYQTTLAAQLDLVCEDAWKSSFCTTLFYTGSLLGNVIYGWVADKWGRRLAIFAILSVAIPVSTLTAFVGSYPVYAVLRTVLGFTFPALYQIPFILALEMMGPAYRTFAGMIICVFFAASLALLSGLARLCQDWFILTLVTSVPFFGLVSYWWIIPESPRWLIQKGRITEAEVIVQKMAKTNGRALPDNYLEGLKSLGDRPAASSSDEPGCGSNSIRPLLFGYPNLRKKFLIIAFSWTANAVVYNGLSYNATNLGVSDYLAFFIGAVVEIPSYFLTYFAMERLGRRVCLCVTMLLGGLACISCLLVPADVVWLTVTLAMVGKFGIASSFAVIYVYAGELLPTVIRSQAMALASFFAGLGLLCFPQIVQLGSYSPVLPLVVMGLVMLLGSMVSFFLPETVHQHLPETLQEGEDFGKNSVCCQSFSSCLGGVRKRPKRRDSSDESDPALRLTSGEEQRNVIEQASTGDG